MLRILAVAAASATLLPVLAACSSSGTPSGAPSSGASTPAAAPVADPVGALVLADAPAGFTERSGQGTGATDLELAARLDGTSGARAALTAEGFQHGYQRLWVDGSGETVGVSVYRFATVAGARAELTRSATVMRAQAEHVRPFVVPGIPRGSVEAVEVDVEGNRTDQLAAVRGRYVMQVICTSRSDARLTARAVGVARRQYARIPST